MKKIFITAILIVAAYDLSAQIDMPAELKTRLAGKTKLYDVQKTVEGYYKELIQNMRPGDSLLKKKAERQRKMWNRQFYWASSHLDANGEVVNAQEAILNAVQQENSVARSAFGEWIPKGPDFVDDGIGRVNRVAFHPTDANTVFIGTPHGGLWKTTDGGNNWSCISSFIPSLGISGIVVDKVNPDIIYILTGDGDGNNGGLVDDYGYLGYSSGVLKTMDAGNTWEQAGTFPYDPARPKYTGYNLVQSPTNSNVMLAATTRGLFKTIDAGATWTMCNLQDPGSSDDTARVYDVSFKPGDESIAYCTISKNGGSRFIRSVDGGSSFLYSNTVNFSPNIFNTYAGRIRIATTPANTNIVYLVAGPGTVSGQTFHGIWRSTDNGANFTKMSSSPDILSYSGDSGNDQSSYDLALAISSTNSNKIVSGGKVVWRSTDGGTSFTEIVDYHTDLDNSNYIHPDVHDLQYNPLDGKLWAATDGGISKSSDDGDNWTRVFNGLQIAAFYHFEPSNEDGYRWGGTQDCGTLAQTAPGNTNYSHFYGGDGFDVMTDKAPAGNNDDSYWVANTNIYADGIVTVNITPPGVNEFFPLLGMKVDNEDVLLAGYSKLYISQDRGDDWDSAWHSPDGNTQYYLPGNWALATCPSNPNKIYCAGITTDGLHSGIYTMSDITDPISSINYNINSGLGLSLGQKITGIAVNPANSDDVYITIGGFLYDKKVFHTTDGGLTWNNITGSLPNLPVNCALYYNDVIYIGTDIGVYVRDGSSTDWTPFYNGLPRVPVTEMFHITRDNTEYIEISTFGRGLWQSEIYEPCTAVLQVDAALQGQQFFQAGAVINSTSVISGGVGTKVNFQAGSYIYLTPGFHAQTGVDFNTILSPCNNGVPQRPVVIEKIETKKHSRSKGQKTEEDD